MRISWIRARRAVVVSAAIMALQTAPALAQFVPYTPNGNQNYNQYQAHTAPQHQVATQYQATVPQYQAQPQYSQPQYTAMAFQGSGMQGAAPSLSQPSETVAPGQMMQSAPVQSYSPAPVQSYSAAPAAGCSTCQSAPAASYSTPAASYESYSMGGCADGSCGSYNTFDAGCGVGGYGACESGCGVGGCGVGGGDCCGSGCGVGGGYLGGCGRGCGRRWFGGFYGLYMERAGNDWKALAFSTPDTNGPGYYPTDTEYVLNLQGLDQDTFVGAEVRFGSTLGRGRCGCGPRFGWEVGYWALDDETQTVTVTDTATDGNRLYTMMPHTGLEYDPGSGYRNVNDYFDYGPPTSDYSGGGALDTLEVRSITARSTFQMQNVEANLLRLPVLGGACCNRGCGGGLQVTGVAGFRYMRLDDDFMYRVDGENTTAATSYFLSRNVDVDSHLAGGQIGCNCCYTFGRCGRWGLHCNSVVGVFNNHTEVWNRMDAPTGGTVRFANNGNDTFNLRYEDDNVSVLGELRVGGSYQYSCNWRLFGGYRLLGLTGVALATDQALNQAIYSSANQVSYVDGDGSLFFHGLQGGVECTY